MNLKSVIETILFINGEPLSIEKMVAITSYSKDEIFKAVEELDQEYKNRGFVILKKDNLYQLGSNPQNSKFVETLIKSELSEELSRSALETIAVIAYKGPLTRAQIEYIRGVNSSYTIRNLLLRGLIERTENPKDARSYIYKISFDFLKHFGLSNLEELPQYQDLNKKEVEIPEENKIISESNSTIQEHKDE